MSATRFGVPRSSKRVYRLTRNVEQSPERGIAALDVQLLREQVVVEPAPLHQLVVRALLDEAAALEDDDQVGVADRAQPVRDHERRAALEQLVEVLLDRALGLGVERARRLVEEQHRRPVVDGARDRDPLLLAARERSPDSPTRVS